MPFLRYERDRRGNLSTYLVHTFRKGGKPHSLVLYWFRSPPNVRVGRLAIDDDTIRTIEELHPDLAFDWPTLLSQRPPPLEMKKWTSKRRQDKTPKKGSAGGGRRSGGVSRVEDGLGSEGDSLESRVGVMDSFQEGMESDRSPEERAESAEMSSPDVAQASQAAVDEKVQVKVDDSGLSQGESELEKPIDQVDDPPMRGTDSDG